MGHVPAVSMSSLAVARFDDSLRPFEQCIGRSICHRALDGIDIVGGASELAVEMPGRPERSMLYPRYILPRYFRLS